MSSLKGPGEAPDLDGWGLRVAIVHARWNTPIISALVAGARKALVQSGVKRENIIVQDVPGSYELPYAVQRLYAASQVQSTTSTNTSNPSVTDLLTSTSVTDLHTAPPPTASTRATEALTSPFDAIIAIGVLIKGETMHFEYIADATSHGLMRVQLDCGVPVVFGLLTVLSEEQAMARAGMKDGSHCHGEDWGVAAVELGLKRRRWALGKIS
ncbi:MAG: hypothetical protein L6R38_000010 [Xanthoria sp. 2 TBL-2021]|nr:MAG: hypothetical protein L6R38_000010 [Xanthoria sp. 2 TBL-2021]